MMRVALIGLGEVGKTFAEDLTSRAGADLAAWDTAFTDPASPASRHAAALPVAAARSAADAVQGADLAVSAVTAANCAAAAAAAAPGLRGGAWYFDLNSSSPGHKREAARTVEAAGGRYVEVALMSPIGPRRLDSPFLLGGPHAADFAATAAGWGFFSSLTVCSAEVGRAAATKLCRSVITKGLEAVLAEAILAARHYGVEDEVLGSLSNILPPADWQAVAAYFISRSLRHGRRRAEEMEEAAATVREAGVAPLMSLAAARRQFRAAGHAVALAGGAAAADALDGAGLFAVIDQIRRSQAAAAASDSPQGTLL